jgi:primosomal protein N' (replication factor Y) (superfamily II helicase)
VEISRTYIDVILPVPLQKVFTYHAPDGFTDDIHVGCRVIVQFGQRKFYTALIKRVHHETPDYDTKPFEVILDGEPIITPHQFPLWEWIAQYYMCSEGEVMKAALPSGLKLESQSSVSANTDWVETEKLKPTEEVVLNFISQQKSATISQINNFTKKSNAYTTIQSLLQKGAVQIEEVLDEGYQPKTVAHVRVSEAFSNEEKLKQAFDLLKRSDKQQQLLMKLLNELAFFSSQPKPSVVKKQLLEETKFSESILKGLVEKGIVEIIEVETDRVIISTNKPLIKNQLNTFQQTALNEIHYQFREKQVVLLHGVTASGKTEIYIKLIEEQLKAGKQVLYLLPEIALTSQLTNRLQAAFGSQAGVYHSKFNDAERVEIWLKVLSFKGANDTHQLVIGARSALFLPFSKLGLIIVDEEHEHSFKQFDPAPRYNARDAAVVLANLHGAKVLMGTATPSFESYFNTKTGKYGLVKLTQRHNNIELPQMVIADLREAYRRKQMKSHFTPELFNEIEQAVGNNEQVILFQNRRGFSPYIQCHSCGWIPKCQHCDVSLTYHKFSNNLVCHYCGYTISLPEKCPDCQSTDVQTKGFGTEKIEDELKIFFPHVKVDRLDIDSSRTKFGYEKILNRFSTQKTQILVGTQMITKGLDFENVSVVGILNADNLFNFPDFRSFERAYQLIAQVSGRAGRKNKQGKVVIQTSQPDHPVISSVITNNYEGFFMSSISERKFFKYPPMFRLIYLTVKHKNHERAMLAANFLANNLRTTFKNRVLGPEFPPVARVQQFYQLTIRIKFEKQLSPTDAKNYIGQSIEKMKQMENNRTVVVIVDVDPY